jgi:hypothetical protein
MATLFDELDRPPAQQHSPTSVAAADAIAPLTATLRRRVYEAIKAAGADGLTDEEGAEKVGISGNTYRPRRRELEQAGRIRDSERTRMTRSNRKAVVWVVV